MEVDLLTPDKGEWIGLERLRWARKFDIPMVCRPSYIVYASYSLFCAIKLDKMPMTGLLEVESSKEREACSSLLLLEESYTKPVLQPCRPSRCLKASPQ